MAGSRKASSPAIVRRAYDALAGGIRELLEAARRASARVTNAVMTATYWEIGRRIVEFEQGGKDRADYGESVLARLSADLGRRFGRGFSVDNLELMRRFYLSFDQSMISETVSRKLRECGHKHDKSATASRKSRLPSMRTSRTPPSGPTLAIVAERFPLPWSHYVRLLSVKDGEARSFYEAEALRGGWTVRQLDRQISSLFYERTALSRNKAAMLKKGARPRPEDAVTPEEEIKDPFVLEFLGLKDEYSETDAEEALIRHLESFLLELGGDFAFVGRQRRLRIGDEWYRIDLLFFHRRLRCLVVIDLKLGKFTHADAGQMHMYLNYAREHWTHEGENPPVGLLLCAQKDDAVAHYALEGLPNKVLAAKYRMVLPDAKVIETEFKKTGKLLERWRRR